MLDFKEIVNAWYNVVNHTPKQKELADNRLQICLTCPSKKEILQGKEWSFVCGECGCPLKAKVFSKKSGKKACPLEKWGEAEEIYFKSSKSLI